MALKTYSLPTLPAATVENANDPVLGWTNLYTLGPTHLEAYSPWAPSYNVVKPGDIADPTTAPTLATAGTGGTLTNATYVYAYAWVGRNGGETLPSSTGSQATTGSTSTVTVTVPAKPAWADVTAVYRQVGGTLRRIGTTATTSFVDTGAADTTNAGAALSTSTALTAVTH